MKIDNNLTDSAVMLELGKRIQEQRFSLKLTQAELAEKSGVSKRTIERIESGESTQLSSFIRILRGIEVLKQFNTVLPEVEISPMNMLKLKGRARQRVARKKDDIRNEDKWQWGDE